MSAELAKLEEQESVQRDALIKDEAVHWEADILEYYRQVAREHNRRVQEQFAPLFEALLKQASRGPS